MRDGIYRVWLKERGGKSFGAFVFKNGDVLACDHSFAFTGRYRKHKNHMVADLKCRRLSRRHTSEHLPDLDTFQLKLSGNAGGEFAILDATIPEVPNFYLPLEFARLGDA